MSLSTTDLPESLLSDELFVGVILHLSRSQFCGLGSTIRPVLHVAYSRNPAERGKKQCHFWLALDPMPVRVDAYSCRKPNRSNKQLKKRWALSLIPLSPKRRWTSSTGTVFVEPSCPCKDGERVWRLERCLLPHSVGFPSRGAFRFI